MSAGSEIVCNSDGSDQISREYFAPGSVDAVSQEVARPLQFGRTGQATDAVFCRVRRASPSSRVRVPVNHMYAESYVLVFCMQNASSSKSEKSLILDYQGNFGFPAVAEEMRRLFGPGCGAARQDASVATAVGMSSVAGGDFAAWVETGKKRERNGKEERGDFAAWVERGDFAAWVAHRNAKKKRERRGRGLATQKSKNKIRGD